MPTLRAISSAFVFIVWLSTAILFFQEQQNQSAHFQYCHATLHKSSRVLKYPTIEKPAVQQNSDVFLVNKEGRIGFPTSGPFHFYFIYIHVSNKPLPILLLPIFFSFHSYVPHCVEFKI